MIAGAVVDGHRQVGWQRVHAHAGLLTAEQADLEGMELRLLDAGDDRRVGPGDPRRLVVVTGLEDDDPERAVEAPAGEDQAPTTMQVEQELPVRVDDGPLPIARGRHERLVERRPKEAGVLLHSEAPQTSAAASA